MYRGRKAFSSFERSIEPKLENQVITEGLFMLLG